MCIRDRSVTPGTSPLPTISSLSTLCPQEGSLSVFCRRLRRSFLIDSGADVSVFPASPARRSARSSASLWAANGSSIRTFGSKTFSLLLPGLSVVHRFILAEVKVPILGTDFFRANNLLIDIPRCRLVRADATPSLVVKARPAVFVGGLCGLKNVPQDSISAADVDTIFSAFPAVTSSSPVYDSTSPKHGVFHTVPTSGPPLWRETGCSQRRVP